MTEACFCAAIPESRPYRGGVIVEFTKMNGAGNDFVLLDNRDGRLRLEVARVAQICDRHRGVGADGLIALIPSRSGQTDWAWEFFNSDGSTAEMCGNGARCFARFVQKLTGAKDRITFETLAGVISASFTGDRVTVGLTRPRDLRLDQTLEVGDQAMIVHALDTGVPHAVVFVDDADRAMVQAWGAVLRFHPHFAPRGTNVNFVQVLRPGAIRVRTYERGVEGETLACGTGVTASALIAACVHDFNPPVSVRVQGGDTLEVAFVRAGDAFDHVRLTGPADFTFEGRLEF
jgi:diaminopimelate epimerase